MFEWVLDGHIWLSFLTLAVLEVILGIDNIIFLSIVSTRLPVEQQKKARFIGLSLALAMRVVLLAGITWLTGLTAAAFSIGEHVVSWRDIILGGGGLFLIYKGTTEIHHTIERDNQQEQAQNSKNSFLSVISMIVVLDLVFSLDSIVTAVGLSNHLPVMIAAIFVAIIIMMLAAEPASAFIQKHPSIKMLALSFLLLVGCALVADGLHFHIPRGYLYFAIAFSLGVECLNLWAARNNNK